ncbi:MFS-type transporter SLC18B1 [Folsomia candida]|uniref:Quinolone resistance protein NorA n=1 Tax=Folsomia candida TaxID=158441 RepID=A0A226CUB3_FOLCA|nr:MFS-type transporter SLC18B1 [Folsomia candida]OXA37035.1 Quinolone resistance protein NorA [Folsomia candida]
MDSDHPESFTDIPLSKDSSTNSLPKSGADETSPAAKTVETTSNSSHREQGEKDASDNDTIVSDSEDKAVAKRYLESQDQQRQHPSFVLGGSDSDSTSVTSVDVERWKRGNPQNTDLPTIPSASNENLNNTNGTNSKNGGRECLPQGKPGYMGGSSGSRSQLDRSPSLELESRLSDKSNHFNHSPAASYTEIRLFATDDEHSVPLTKRQWVTFAVFGFVEIFSAMVISLQAPFYPLEAEKKGATATEFGLVFGIFELVVFIISPIYGSKINAIGPKLVFNLGIFVTSLSAIGFGFLDKVDDRTLFVGLSIGIRVIEALGEAAFITASFIIILRECGGNLGVATTFAAMESFYGLGLIIGPLAGGFLYQIGGYTLPFVSVGGLLLLAALFTTFALPGTKNQRELSSTSSSRSSTPRLENRERMASVSSGGFQMFSLFTVPAIALAAFSIFSASASISYLNATLEPFIRINNLSPSPLATGAIFIVNGGVYAISSPIWGWICDRAPNRLKLVSILGCLLMFVGFGLIGPIPYVPLQPSLWGVIVGQAIQGVGLGAVLVSAFIQSLQEAIKTGLPDDIQTYSLVSGVWTSMFALGAFTGATCSGLLYDIVGFRMGTFSILGLQLFVAILVFLSTCSINEWNEDEDENSPLLSSQQYNRQQSTSKLVASLSSGRPGNNSPVPGTSKSAQRRHNGTYNDNVGPSYGAV